MTGQGRELERDEPGADVTARRDDDGAGEGGEEQDRLDRLTRRLLGAP